MNTIMREGDINVEAIHPLVKKALRYDAKTSDKVIIADWKRRAFQLCKPCWELHYCPYGPMVEDFPLLPVTRGEAIEHNRYMQSCIRKGQLPDGRLLDKKRREFFRRQINEFDAGKHPKSLPVVLMDASCRQFGHLCPVFFMAEYITETKSRRIHSRRILREVMLKVVRRDGLMCQRCGELVRDDEVEFDHLIPFSKGGCSSVENLRVVHRRCNRKKKASLEGIL
jgi:hypothetical protein